MSFLSRGLFVVTGIIVGATSINYFVLGNTADYGLPNERLGAWREAQVRPACYGALEFAHRDRGNPRPPIGQNRISLQDQLRAVELTAALHCYLVTQRNAVCEPNNRAYVVDYIAKYFEKMNSMLETAARYDAEEIRIVRQLWDSPNNRAITAALDNHIRDGRLKKSDFGWSAPAALKHRLQETVNAPDLCAKERPWVASKL